MDISRSEADGGNSSDDLSKLPNDETEHRTETVDDEDSYEPPSDISVIPQHKLDLRNVHNPTDIGRAETGMPGLTNYKSTVDMQEARSPQPNDEFTLIADAQGEEQNPQCSPALTDSSDSDDYEPPEPAPLVSELAAATQVTLAESSLSPPSDFAIDGDAAMIHPSSLPILDEKDSTGTAMGSAVRGVGYRV